MSNSSQIKESLWMLCYSKTYKMMWDNNSKMFVHIFYDINEKDDFVKIKEAFCEHEKMLGPLLICGVWCPYEQCVYTQIQNFGIKQKVTV